MNYVWAFVVGGAILAGACLLFQKPLLGVLGANEALMRDCIAYGTIMLAGAPIFLLQTSCQSFLVVAERPKMGLGLAIGSGVTNMLLDYVFIALFRWGVAGAAIATVSAQLISTIGCFCYAFFRYPDIRLHREDWRITWWDIRRHVTQGIPLGLQFSVLAVGIIVMQSVVVRFDMLDGVMVSSAAQNGFGAANKLSNLVTTPMNGLGAAMTSFTVHNLGAGEHERIKKGTLQSLAMMAVLVAAAAGIGLLL